MVLTAVTNRDALLALLLFETAWWGTTIIGCFIQVYLTIRLTGIGDADPTALLYLGFLVVKFLSSGLLWIGAFLKSKERYWLLGKIWFIFGIFVDILILALVVVHGFSNKMPLSFVIPLLSIVSIRILFWISAGLILRNIFQSLDFHHEYKWEKSFLIWEIFWYLILLISFATGNQYKYIWSLILPNYFGPFGITVIVSALLVGSALTTFLGILRNWKIFLKFWLVFYSILGLGVYTWANGTQLIDQWEQRRKHAEFSINVPISTIFLLIALTLRTMTVVRCFQFAYSPGPTRASEPRSLDLVKEGTTLEKQPLLNNSPKEEETTAGVEQ